MPHKASAAYFVLTAAIMLSTASPAKAALESGARDAQLQAAVLQALALEPVFQLWPLEAQVKAGIVKLQGTVPSPEHRELAQQIANEIDGTLRVTNQIAIRRLQRLAVETSA